MCLPVSCGRQSFDAYLEWTDRWMDPPLHTYVPVQALLSIINAKAKLPTLV